MQQDYSQYNERDREIWKTLFDAQVKNLPNKACDEYTQTLEELNQELNSNAIVNISKLNSKLMMKNGWSVEVVEGLIPVEEFFVLILNKKFPSSTWLRSKDKLDYLKEPDMFHDIFGHVPLLIDDNYAKFMQKFGEIGVRHKDKPVIVKQLQTLYWFTIEFGLIKKEDKFNIYGAGILSSSGETEYVFNQNIKVLPFDIETIINTPYDISRIQEVYFQIDSFKQLYQSLDYNFAS